MNDENTVLGIEFGDPSNPIAIGSMYNEEEKKYGITIYQVINNEGLKTGDEVPFERIGNLDFLLIFRTESSVNTMIECLNWIKNRMEEEKNND